MARAVAAPIIALVANDDWRIEVELSDQEHGFSLGERLRALDLDDNARNQLGNRAVVTHLKAALVPGVQRHSREW